MYHYLKWAALSLFFRRNLRVLLLIAFSFLGILFLNNVYQDIVAYAQASGHKDALLYLLIGKWGILLFLFVLMLYGLSRLGFGKEKGKEGATRAQSSKKSASTLPDAKEDARIMQRLEKFREPRRLRRKSDLLMEKLRKEGES